MLLVVYLVKLRLTSFKLLKNKSTPILLHNHKLTDPCNDYSSYGEVLLHFYHMQQRWNCEHFFKKSGLKVRSEALKLKGSGQKRPTVTDILHFFSFVLKSG